MHCHRCVGHEGSLTEWFRVASGVKQGCLSTGRGYERHTEWSTCRDTMTSSSPTTPSCSPPPSDKTKREDSNASGWLGLKMSARETKTDRKWKSLTRIRTSAAWWTPDDDALSRIDETRGTPATRKPLSLKMKMTLFLKPQTLNPRMAQNVGRLPRKITKKLRTFVHNCLRITTYV